MSNSRLRTFPHSQSVKSESSPSLNSHLNPHLEGDGLPLLLPEHPGAGRELRLLELGLLDEVDLGLDGVDARAAVLAGALNAARPRTELGALDVLGKTTRFAFKSKNNALVCALHAFYVVILQSELWVVRE